MRNAALSISQESNSCYIMCVAYQRSKEKEWVGNNIERKSFSRARTVVFFSSAALKVNNSLDVKIQKTVGKDMKIQQN